MPLHNDAPKCCSNPLGSLQETNEAASTKPSQSLVNGTSQGTSIMTLQKHSMFPVESQETPGRLSAPPVLNNVILREHLLGRERSRTSQDSGESTSLMQVGQR